MPDSYLQALLKNLRGVREKAGLSEAALEERLILGPGWVTRFETGNTIPSIDMVLAILNETQASLSQLVDGLPAPEAAEIERSIFAEQDNKNLIINFQYAKHNAKYTLQHAQLSDFESVLKVLRDGLARLVIVEQDQGEAIKRDSVAKSFLEAVKLWPHANPSDLWYFLISRAYCDPYNHPAKYARLDFSQSWKRTGGWALEEILVRHYGPFLKTQGINLFIADNAEKQELVKTLNLADRVEADKIDVVLTGDIPEGTRFFGVVHVKASFAERRTDDVPLSLALIRAGYTSPLWTMDCKSTPSTAPVNKGELGAIENRRSAKRKDIEDDGYFTGCFSYNANTQESLKGLPEEKQIHVCNFSDPNDQFSQFIIRRWQLFRSA